MPKQKIIPATKTRKNIIDKNSLKTMGGMRNHLESTLAALHNQEIEPAEAATTYKLSEAWIGTIKVELDFANMMGRKPNIPPLENSLSKEVLPLRAIRNKTSKNSD